MSTYRPYLDFTAQSRTVASLMVLHSQYARERVPLPDPTPIVVFTAFAIEGYLNSIGARKIVFWDELERLPWKQKVEILHKNAEAAPNWGKDPLQFASEVFRLRDKLAHGKSERVWGPKCVDEEKAGRLVSSANLQPDWYRGLTKDWVVDSKERFRCLMKHLGGLYGLHESDHLQLASGAVSIDDND